MNEVRMLNKEDYIELRSRLRLYFENELTDYSRLFTGSYITLEKGKGWNGTAPYFGIEEERERDISHVWLDSNDNDNSIGYTNTVRHFDDETYPGLGIKVIADFNKIDGATEVSMYHNHEIYTWGEYPQTKATEEESEKLDRLLELGFLGLTGKTYTYNKNCAEEGKDPEYEYLVEYEADDKKYIHLFESTEEGLKSRWIRVEPIEWIVDYKTGLGITKKVLMTGIPLKDKKGNNVLKDYVENTLSEEVKTSEVYKQLSLKI